MEWHNPFQVYISNRIRYTAISKIFVWTESLPLEGRSSWWSRWKVSLASAELTHYENDSSSIPSVCTEPIIKTPKKLNITLVLATCTHGLLKILKFIVWQFRYFQRALVLVLLTYMKQYCLMRWNILLPVKKET